jgi:hypothetical protein
MFPRGERAERDALRRRWIPLLGPKGLPEETFMLSDVERGAI